MSIKSADADIKLASYAISPIGNPTNDETMISLAAYHVQQAVEKLLKYILHDIYGEDDTAKRFRTHKIYDLITMLEEYDYKVSDEIKDKSITLTDWEAQSRYNDSPVATKAEIMECIKIYEEMRNELLQKPKEQE